MFKCYYINNRQPEGSLSNVLSRLAVVVRVDGEDETQRKEHELNLNLNLNSSVPHIPVSVFAASFRFAQTTC